MSTLPWPFSSQIKDTHHLYIYNKPWTTQELGRNLPSMLLESIILSITPNYYLICSIWIAPNFGQPSGPCFHGLPNPWLLHLHLPLSPHDSTQTSSPRNLTCVSSVQLIAVVIFIYQSEGIWGQGPLASIYLWTLISEVTNLGGPRLALEYK